MDIIVEKRDGEIRPFEVLKIYKSISRAAKDTSLDIKDSTISKLAYMVAELIEERSIDRPKTKPNVNGINKVYADIFHIEPAVMVTQDPTKWETSDIQDIVVDILNKNGYQLIAKSYLDYRNERTKIRHRKEKSLYAI